MSRHMVKPVFLLLVLLSLLQPANLVNAATPCAPFEGGRVDFTFSLPDDTPEDRARLQQIKQKIMQHLGDHIYADDATTSLEDRVVELLRRRGLSLGAAEVATAGIQAAGEDKAALR